MVAAHAIRERQHHRGVRLCKQAAPPHTATQNNYDFVHLLTKDTFEAYSRKHVRRASGSFAMHFGQKFFPWASAVKTPMPEGMFEVSMGLALRKGVSVAS